jgi:anti-sigma B factor antagonist
MGSSVRSESFGEIRTIQLTDAKILDESVIQQISQDLIELLGKTEETNVVLDFDQVRFMSSSALGMLIKVNKKCKEFKIDLKLCNIAPDIMQVFKITRLDKILAIYPDSQAAFAAFKKSGLFFRK